MRSVNIMAIYLMIMTKLKCACVAMQETIITVPAIVRGSYALLKRKVKKMWREFTCFVGWHEWTWKASDFIDEFGDADWESFLDSEKPPSFAKCKHCGERYGDERK